MADIDDILEQGTLEVLGPIRSYHLEQSGGPNYGFRIANRAVAFFNLNDIAKHFVQYRMRIGNEGFNLDLLRGTQEHFSGRTLGHLELQQAKDIDNRVNLLYKPFTRGTTDPICELRLSVVSDSPNALHYEYARGDGRNE